MVRVGLTFVDGYRVEDEEPWLTKSRQRAVIELVVTFVLFFALAQVTSAEKAVASIGTIWLMYALLTVMKDYRHEVGSG